MAAAAALPGSMPGALPNQSSSPMMSGGFGPASQMTHDQVVSGTQMAIAQQQMQMVQQQQQPLSVAQMQVRTQGG